jgi:hypothetical protein
MIEELTDAEMDLILLIRKKYRYGEITVIIHDGQPRQVMKTIERKLLGQLSPEDFDDNL